MITNKLKAKPMINYYCQGLQATKSNMIEHIEKMMANLEPNSEIYKVMNKAKANIMNHREL